MSKKICILTDHHLSANPRSWKEARSLSRATYRVVVLSVFTSTKSLKKDLDLIKGYNITYKAAVDFTSSKLDRILLRGRRKAATILKRLFNQESPLLLGYAPGRLYREAVKENADLYIAHIDCCLYVGVKLATAGYRVAFDFEDWYSKDYLVPSRPVKLLESLERSALKLGCYCSCPSNAMAEAIALFYSSAKPVTIYNGFSMEETVKKPVHRKPRSMVWFSQTIGPGRGLEKLIKALMNIVEPIELHLIGDISDEYRNYLNGFFTDISHSLFIYPQVRHEDLIGFISRFFVGVAIEECVPESRNVTITNKIVQYIQAGNRVLATNTEGQLEIAKYFQDLIMVIEGKNTSAWSSAIEELLNRSLQNGSEGQMTFNEIFSWEAQEKKLLNLVKMTLNAE